MTKLRWKTTADYSCGSRIPKSREPSVRACGTEEITFRSSVINFGQSRFPKPKPQPQLVSIYALAECFSLPNSLSIKWPNGPRENFCNTSSSSPLSIQIPEQLRHRSRGRP
jgi:hypothetical protein